MPVTFDTYDLKKALDIVASRANAQAIINLAYVSGDHWQKATGWAGPMPTGTDSVKPLAEIERAFVSRNAIAEVTWRHVGGCLAKTMHWKFTPARTLGKVEREDEETGELVTEDEQPDATEDALISEAEQALVEWWDKRGVQESLQQMAALLLTAKRAPLRLYIPPGLRDEQGNIPSGGLTDSLNRIWLQSLGTNEDTLELQIPSATVYTDKLTRQEIGIFTYKEVDPLTGQADKEERAELSYLDDAGNTVLRILNGDTVLEEVTLPLGGRLTLYEATRQPLITPQIVSQQRLLNLALTMKQHNIVLAGYLERILLNAQLPGRYERNPTTGVERFVPDPLYTGAGTTNVIVGVKYVDANGNEQIATPSVVYRDPVPVDTFEATESSAYLAILQEAQQLHYALAGDAVVSGESRQQARDAFEKDLHLTAGKVEAAARWILETALSMAAVFSGQAGRYDGLRAYVQARVDSGPISADEMRVASDMVKDELWSRETGMSATGIEDVDAEMERIERERNEKMKQMTPMEKLNMEQLQIGVEMQRKAANGEGMTDAQSPADA